MANTSSFKLEHPLGKSNVSMPLLLRGVDSACLLLVKVSTNDCSTNIGVVFWIIIILRNGEVIHLVA
jgi:hypothetical protein